MSLARSRVQNTWVKSASTTQLNKIRPPPKAVPLYNTVVLKEGFLLVRRFKGKATVSQKAIATYLSRVNLLKLLQRRLYHSCS